MCFIVDGSQTLENRIAQDLVETRAGVLALLSRTMPSVRVGQPGLPDDV